MDSNFKIASWNVNSLKVRLEQVIDWFNQNQIDLLALQETKLTDENFPLNRLQEQGWHIAFSGQKTYNGMAIISRQPLQDVMTDLAELEDPQRRILAATIGDVRLINLYVPNGSEVGSEKYAYKLDWLNKVRGFIQQQLALYPKVAVVGDFNIAPEDRDVHDPAALAGCVLVSPPERAALQAILELGLCDSYRHFNPTENQYSWWDYRAAAFRRNMGLRIDLILLSESLKHQCIESGIDANPRRHERPSDHAPVWVSLNK